MEKQWETGILGCGDFLRCMTEDLKKSLRLKVKALYDPDKRRAEKYAGHLGGEAVADEESIFADPDIKLVCLFTPPWARKKQVRRAAEAGQHILATKPLGAHVADCAAMVKAAERKVGCGVLYGRNQPVIETCRDIFESGEIGRLALYKQDWLHHYPEWNQWALDPDKNGGPFMDAMIHNLNTARYLMARPAVSAVFFSSNHAHPGLSCNDTEFLRLEFEGGGAAHLFISWAADLAVFSKEANDREHIDIFYMITDQGWRVTRQWEKGGLKIKASKDGKEKNWPVKHLEATIFDEFIESVERNAPLPRRLPGIREAYEDVKLLRDAEARLGRPFPVDLSLP